MKKNKVLFVAAMALGLVFSVTACGGGDTPSQPIDPPGPVEKTLTELTISTSKVKKEFDVGDEFTSAGLICIAKFSDGSSNQVSPDVTAPDMTTAGLKTVTVSYTAGGVTLSKTYTITVKGSGPVDHYDFNIGLLSGREEVVYKGAETSDKVVVYASDDGKERKFTYEVTEGDEYLKILQDGTLNPLKASGNVWCEVTVTEVNSQTTRTLDLKVKDFPTSVDGGFNWAADRSVKTEVLGELERYAMENYLTGITLFENGGYVRYADATIASQDRKDNRIVHLPTKEYITGYGFGLLAEGWIEGTLENGSTQYPTYLHNASSSDPLTINAWNAAGSQVSDLNSYITTSYWGTKLDGLTKYKWYPILAKDTVNGKEFNRPIHLDPDNDLGMYTKWRIYVKTGEEEGLKYRTASTKMASFNNRPVKLEDYEFVYQLLLTERSDLLRGSELAGDTSYGIKGALSFYNNTKDVYDIETIDKEWKKMQANGTLGVKTGKDSNGSYIDLELINPIDDFTAMYTLSSTLYSPMPREFIEALDPENHSYIEGVQNYGNFSDKNNILDTVLCVGPYYLKDWQKNQEIDFARNNDWYEVSATRYRIEGIHTRVYSAMTQQQDYGYNLFLNGELDSTGIPQKRMSEKTPDDLKTKGSSTFKLNVNSCTQERWNELFGDKGQIKIIGDNAYLVKPWMSNRNFLNGLYWSIDRKSFADARGVNPSISYLADAYMADPQNGVSYNSTDAHKNAIAPFHNTQNEDYGYNLDKAVTYFKMAVDELVNEGLITKGTKEKPTVISIDIEWMYASDVRDYGEEIGGYFTAAFNNEKVSGGTVKLEVHQDAVTQWEQVYNDYLMVGKYDLGFGAISGNTYDPLNFFEVLKSDNSSNFTLNWGENTSKVSKVNPITFRENPADKTSPERAWSFDSLWEAADHGAVVDDGVSQKPVKDCYLNVPKTYDGTAQTNNLYLGCQIDVPFAFIELDRPEGEIELEISKVNVWLRNGAVDGLMITDFSEGSRARITRDAKGRPTMVTIMIEPEKAEEINTALVKGNKLEDKVKDLTDPDEIFRILHPFTKQNYNMYWNVEVYYTLRINGGYPTETLVNAAADKDSQKTRSLLSLAH